jgi:UDP-N-acetylmuramoylalanine--D-glutamate ligase
MNKRIVILGAGESGAGSAVLAKQKGFDVFVSDSGTAKDKYREILVSHGIAFEEGQHTPELIMNAGEVIKSPACARITPSLLPSVKRVSR